MKIDEAVSKLEDLSPTGIGTVLHAQTTNALNDAVKALAAELKELKKGGVKNAKSSSSASGSRHK